MEHIESRQETFRENAPFLERAYITWGRWQVLSGSWLKVIAMVCMSSCDCLGLHKAIRCCHTEITENTDSFFVVPLKLQKSQKSAMPLATWNITYSIR